MTLPTVFGAGAGGAQHEQRIAIIAPASQSFAVRDLVYPYRYDILSRCRQARWCAEHQELWKRDELAFLRKAREETRAGAECDMLTYIWRKWAYGEDVPGPSNGAFRVDMQKFLLTLHSLTVHGFQPGEGRLQVIWGRELGRGIDGREDYVRNWFMADGQHRLCCLLEFYGITEIPAEWVEVLDYRHFKPFATTRAYLEMGWLADMATFRRELDEMVAGAATKVAERTRLQSLSGY